MGPFYSGVYGASYRVLVWGRAYVRGREVGLRYSGYLDRAPRRAQNKQRRRQGRRRRADSDGRHVDGRTTETGDSDDDVDADKDPFGSNLIPGRSDGLVSVLLHGTGSVRFSDRFTNLLMYLTSERTRVRRREGGETKGPPRIFSSSSAYADDVAIPAEGGMVMETTMKRDLRYLSFR